MQKARIKTSELIKGADVCYREGKFLGSCPYNRKVNSVTWVVLQAVKVKINGHIEFLVIYWPVSLCKTAKTVEARTVDLS